MRLRANLFAARKYTTSVLLALDIQSDEITLHGFIKMLDYLVEHPAEYYKLQNGEHTEDE